MSTYFDSRKNYLKVFMKDGPTIDRPATLDGTFNEYYTTYTVDHDLGYRPLVRAWYDPDGSGMKFPMNGQKFFAASEFYFQQDVEFMFYVDDITTTSVTFRAARESGDGALTGTFQFWYKIYLDPTRGVQP